MPHRQRKTEYLLTALAVALILCYLAVFAFIGFRGFARLSTSDMYEDTLAARLMWEQKTLFPSNFLFGNQFYIIATPVLSALFYGLTGSMNRAMVMATGCMSLFLLASMAWMLRPYVKRRSVRAAVLLVFMASVFGPYSVFREDGQQLFFAMCSFYACYLLCFFVVLGDYARARDSQALRLPALLLSLFLCFCTGMQSLRQTCVLILPLLGYEALSAVWRLWKKRPLYPRGGRMRLWRTLGYAGANVLGLVVIRLLSVKRHEIFAGGASLRAKLRDVQDALVTVTGYDYTREGAGRLFYILMFLALTVLVLGAISLFLRRRRGAAGVGCFWLVALLGCLAVIAASFVTRVRLRPIYLFLYYTLPALSLALIAERAKPERLSALLTALCLLAGANLYFSYRDDLSIVLAEEPTPAQQIAAWAEAEGYELVYGQSLSAPYVAVCSDGALTAGCWQDDVLFKVSPHINIRDIYHIEDYARAIFVFTEGELAPMLAETTANGTRMTERGHYGYYYVYTADQQCLWPVTELIDYAEKFPEYN